MLATFSEFWNIILAYLVHFAYARRPVFLFIYIHFILYIPQAVQDLRSCKPLPAPQAESGSDIPFIEVLTEKGFELWGPSCLSSTS